MSETREEAFSRISTDLGYSFAGDIKGGGNYVPFVVDGNEVYVSGQVPRVGDSVVVTGRAGADVPLPRARIAAQVCVMRAVALLRQALGDLKRVKKIVRITVFVQCAPDFTQQSEVADAASDVLHSIFGEAGKHTRTSIGVYQLPKNATVEIDLIARTE
jgi:enamine deaminase RidA (YjgF/YER057c/UK114 family)